MANKAHAAVVRRLTERYCANGAPPTNEFDIHLNDLLIEVETSATLRAGLEKLQQAQGRRFLAVTNREAIEDALAVTEATPIGVMDPWGNVVREAGQA